VHLACVLQGNLKAFAGGRQQQLAALAFDELAFELERIQQREQLTLQAQSRADRDEPSRLPSQPPPLSLRAFPVRRCCCTPTFAPSPSSSSSSSGDGCGTVEID
jgi:hypothetical protein